MGIGDVTGSVPDVVSMALGLSDAMAPDKGFAYNLCTFQINLREEDQDEQKEKQPASIATPASGNKTASAATPGSAKTSANLVSKPGPVVFTARIGENNGGSINEVVEVGIREISTSDRIVGVVELRTLEGFDTSIFSNLSIEVVVQEQQIVPRGVMLMIKGLMNPAGLGFAHFIGGILVSAEAGAGRPYFVCKPQFITQAPARGTGMGIFGWVIEASYGVSQLAITAKLAPMFSK